MRSPVPIYLMCRHDSMAVVPPPNTHTVKNTMRRVVLNIICRAYVAVSRMAKANAIAPRRPAGDTSALSITARYISYITRDIKHNLNTQDHINRYEKVLTYVKNDEQI